jgi:hypothetical protein
MWVGIRSKTTHLLTSILNGGERFRLQPSLLSKKDLFECPVARRYSDEQRFMNVVMKRKIPISFPGNECLNLAIQYTVV